MRNNTVISRRQQKTSSKKAISIIAFSAMLLIIGFFLFYFTFNLVAPNMTVKRLGFKTYNILTESMVPVLNKGDLICVTKHDFLELKEGDIVTFIDPLGNVVTHNFARYEYISQSNDNGIVVTSAVMRTKPQSDSDGNATNQLDFWRIDEENYIGKYSFKIAGLGHVVMFLQSWLGILSIALFFGALYVIKVLIEYKKKSKKKEE